MDEWMERVCDSVPVPGAPDGFSVVGTIVVGAGVGVDVVGASVGFDVVGASVGVDVVGASVGAAAAHTFASCRCSAGAVQGDTSRVPPPAIWYPMCTLGYSLVPARTARGQTL